MSRNGLNWMQWNPGVNHGERTFAEVLSTLPAAKPEDIPWIIRFFENPSSKWASPGAITLARHDHIHVILGRGLKSEDEAFVIGFTNGSATTIENNQTRLLRALTYVAFPFRDKERRDRKIRDWQYAVYQFAATRLYKPPYRFTADDIVAFKLGFGFGERNRVRDLQDFPFEEHEASTIDDMRERLGINVAQLEATYRYERMLLHTKESERLDVDFDEDHSDLTTPDAPNSDWVRDRKIPLKR